MIQIKLYAGTDAELSDFIQAVWMHDYAQKMIFPIWTAEYFAWQLQPMLDNNQRLIIAAYNAEKLVAVLAGNTFDFLSQQGKTTGSQWSWLSIHPDYRGQQLAKRLNQFRIDLLKQLQQELIVSYRYVGSNISRAERPRKNDQAQKFHTKLGFWSRVIHPQRFSKWHVNGLERNLVWLASPLIPTPNKSSNNTAIKAYQPRDLPRALALINQAYQICDLKILWNETSLHHQLGGASLAQTFVAYQQETLVALINFHILEFQALTREKVAIIDIACCLPDCKATLNKLMKHAIANMYEQGAILVLKLRCGDVYSSIMLQQHFIPLPAESYLVLDWVNQHIPISKRGNLHLLWR